MSVRDEIPSLRCDNAAELLEITGVGVEIGAVQRVRQPMSIKRTLRPIAWTLAPRVMDRRFLRSKRDLAEAQDRTGILFIHIPKTGGVSVTENIYGRRLSHSTWREIRAAHPKRFDRLFKVAVTRNPMSRFLSAYDYLLNGEFFNGSTSHFSKGILGAFEDANSFIAALSHPKLLSSVLSFSHFRPQVEFVATRECELRTNRLIPFERMNEELPALFGVADLPRLNVTQGKRTTPSDLTEASIRRIQAIYAEDYVLHRFALLQNGDVYGRKYL